MDPAQIELVKSTFDRMDHESLVHEMYQRLFDADPELREMFRAEIGVQARRMTDTLARSVLQLDDPRALEEIYERLGQTHVGYGVRAADFVTLKSALLGAIQSQLGDNDGEDAVEAWTLAYDAIANLLKRHLAAARTTPTTPPNGAPARADHYLARFMPPQPARAGGSTPDAAPPPSDALIEVEYVGERTAEAAPLQTILEISLGNEIEHIFECGGQSRCSTCRVEILEGLDNCLERTPAEARIAQSKGFPPMIRLACQTKVRGPVTLRRLLFDRADVAAVLRDEGGTVGQEMHLAVLFSDVRSFTRITEKNLAYDVVHMLNRYYNAMGRCAHQHYGYIDKYMGDGMMVLFGLDPERESDPCLDAVRAAVDMQEELSHVNEYLREHFDLAFEFGVGIHYGPVIVGEVGFFKKRQLTALGDVVNVASRIENTTKDLDARLLVSEEVHERVTPEFETGRTAAVELRGTTGPRRLFEILGRQATDHPNG